ncbi:type II secretion system F family protein [Massilia sp. TSP1-1-2]|uniref:type II secretion system F family protein n=1 Tax=Massilia sp. TSP1-1-2 TaxID=2804649 RepID=UPI003CFA06B2
MRRFPPLSLPVRALLFQHLGAMEKAGMPAERAHALLDLGPTLRGRVEAFRDLCGRGVDVPGAGSRSGLFTLFETRLLRAAFAAGTAQTTYERLARSLAGAAAQQRALRSRLMLPGAVLAIALFVQPLPQLFSGALKPTLYLAKALLPLVLLATAGMLVMRTSAWFASGEPGVGRATLERLLLALPIVGKVHLRRNTRDFVESLALLLQAGLSLFEALPVAVATVDNQLVRRDLHALLPAVQSGAPLSSAVAALRLVDKAQLHAMVHLGEESGTLAAMLQRHADAESVALAQIQREMMTWLPRLLYSMVALWMAFQILGGTKLAQDSAAISVAVPQWRG